MGRFNGCWLTTNRSCNIRCSWCYAFGTGFLKEDEMFFANAVNAINLCEQAGIKRIILIGGEPTLYSHIFDVIKYCSEKGIKTTLVTNGIVFANEKNVLAYKEAGLDAMSVSLKAPNADAYKELTGGDYFDKVIEAIRLLSKNEIRFSVSTVITDLNVDNFIDGLKAAKEAGARRFGLSFCYNFDMNDNSKEEFLKKNNPFKLSKRFFSHYQELKETLEGCSWSLEQAMPLCVWDDEPIEIMNNDGHLRSICQLLRGNGLLFDTDLSLIPCNAMYKLKYGKYGKDFNDYESLLKYLETDEVKAFFNKLRGVPDMKCLECEKAKNCGGGCVTNWSNYTFDELFKLKGE